MLAPVALKATDTGVKGSDRRRLGVRLASSGRLVGQR